VCPQVATRRYRSAWGRCGTVGRYAAAEMMRELGDKDDDEPPMILGLVDGRRLALEMASIGPLLLTCSSCRRRGLELSGGRYNQSGRCMRPPRDGGAAMEEAAWRRTWCVAAAASALRALGAAVARARRSLPAAKVPKWFTATLRPQYQQRGVEAAILSERPALAGLLAR